MGRWMRRRRWIVGGRSPGVSRVLRLRLANLRRRRRKRHAARRVQEVERNEPKIGRFLNARAWLLRLVRATLRPRPKSRLWEWLEKFVVIPVESGSPNPGP